MDSINLSLLLVRDLEEMASKQQFIVLQKTKLDKLNNAGYEEAELTEGYVKPPRQLETMRFTCLYVRHVSG